jgi:hypothetical protein
MAQIQDEQTSSQTQAHSLLLVCLLGQRPKVSYLLVEILPLRLIQVPLVPQRLQFLPLILDHPLVLLQLTPQVLVGALELANLERNGRHLAGNVCMVRMVFFRARRNVTQMLELVTTGGNTTL